VLDPYFSAPKLAWRHNTGFSRRSVLIGMVVAGAGVSLSWQTRPRSGEPGPEPEDGPPLIRRSYVVTMDESLAQRVNWFGAVPTRISKPSAVSASTTSADDIASTAISTNA